MIEYRILDEGSIERARTRLRLMRHAFELAPRELTQAAARIYRDKLREHAPKRTGELARSHRFRTFPTGMGWNAEFSALKRSVFVINGTRPHVIIPRMKLALFWATAAHPYVRVNHPGTKANDYRKRAVEAAREEVHALTRAAVVGVARTGRL